MKGEIRSIYNAATGTTDYFPGPSQDAYEQALITYLEPSPEQEDMEIDVSGLPDYVDEGATGAKPLSEYQFSESYTDYPVSASNNARKAIEWRSKYPNEIQGGTQIGWTRANQLANRRPISEETIARMSSFARHRSNAVVDVTKKDKPWTDAGYVAWLIWGGTSGVNWAQEKLERIRRSKGQRMEEEFADPADLKVGDEVSWQTAGSNPRGKIREIVREGSKKIPGSDFEIKGTEEDPGYIIELYEEDAEGNWSPTGTLVGRKADSILKNITL
jgi:hypothetical protein